MLQLLDSGTGAFHLTLTGKLDIDDVLGSAKLRANSSALQAGDQDEKCAEKILPRN